VIEPVPKNPAERYLDRNAVDISATLTLETDST
jgi:hypothetical protein